MASKEYHKQYYQKNKEIIKARAKLWRSKHPARKYPTDPEVAKRYREANKDRIKAQQKDWYEKKKANDARIREWLNATLF